MAGYTVRGRAALEAGAALALQREVTFSAFAGTSSKRSQLSGPRDDPFTIVDAFVGDELRFTSCNQNTVQIELRLLVGNEGSATGKGSGSFTHLGAVELVQRPCGG